jgi:hypothetical protein
MNDLQANRAFETAVPQDARFAFGENWKSFLAELDDARVAEAELSFVLLGRNFQAYVAEFGRNRGMTFSHSVRDWVGGYPHESIRPAEIDDAMSRLGFAHVRSKV